MKAMRIPMTFDAFHATFHNKVDKDNWPQWLTDVFGQHIYEHKIATMWKMSTEEEIILVYENDWILCDENRKLFYCNGADFPKEYLVELQADS